MSTVTYYSALDAARKTYDTLSAGINAKIPILEHKISSLNNLAARPYAEIKDQLKQLIQEGLTELPTVLATCKTAYTELRSMIQHLDTLSSKISLLPKKHLIHLECKETEQLLKKEQEDAINGKNVSV
jgi:hypothetical protein